LGALYNRKPDKIKKTFTRKKMFSAVMADIKPLARARRHTSVGLDSNAVL
jgi:hypothetical protein